MRLEPLEAAVLEKLLDGDHPVLTALRHQLPGTRVTSRELTGVGFFTTFSVAAGPLDRAPIVRAIFGDVVATIPGLAHGAGFLLYLEDGLLHMLEGYTYADAEPWPERIDEFSLGYLHHDRTVELANLR